MNMLEARGYIKKFKYSEMLPFVIGSTFTMYCMAWEPDCLTKSFYSFYLKGSGMNANDVKLCNTWAQMLKDGKRVD